MSLFEERYRVIGVDKDRLLVRGVVSGDLLTIIKSQTDPPLAREPNLLGALIALSDPSTASLN